MPQILELDQRTGPWSLERSTPLLQARRLFRSFQHSLDPQTLWYRSALGKQIFTALELDRDLSLSVTQSFDILSWHLGHCNGLCHCVLMLFALASVRFVLRHLIFQRSNNAGVRRPEASLYPFYGAPGSGHPTSGPMVGHAHPFHGPSHVSRMQDMEAS